MELRHNGELGIISAPGDCPGIMRTIIGRYDSEAEKIKHYRVDKCFISGCLREAEREKNILKSWIWRDYAKKVWKMFGETSGQ